MQFGMLGSASMYTFRKGYACLLQIMWVHFLNSIFIWTYRLLFLMSVCVCMWFSKSLRLPVGVCGYYHMQFGILDSTIMYNSGGGLQTKAGGERSSMYHVHYGASSLIPFQRHLQQLTIYLAYLTVTETQRLPHCYAYTKQEKGEAGGYRRHKQGLPPAVLF